MRREVVRALVAVLLCTSVIGCRAAALEPGPGEAEELEEVLLEGALPEAQEEEEEIQDETPVREPVAEAVWELQPPILPGDPPPVTEEEEEVNRLVYQAPEPSPEPPYDWVSASLDLSSSTRQEVIIKILYFDEVGKRVYPERSVGSCMLAVVVRIWKGNLPTKLEKEDSNYVDEHIVFGRELPSFNLSSSKDVIVIPTSHLVCEATELTLEVIIAKWVSPEWGYDPTKTEVILHTSLQKNW